MADASSLVGALAREREARRREKRERRMAMDALVSAWVENAQLRAEVRELEASFDIRWKADMRAIKRWQEATGRVLTWPDHADLVVWLLEQLEGDGDAAAD